MPAERPLTLADVGNITGRVHDEAPESTIGGQTTCIVCMVGPKSHLAVPARVRALHGQHEDLPVLSHARTALGDAAVGVML